MIPTLISPVAAPQPVSVPVPDAPQAAASLFAMAAQLPSLQAPVMGAEDSRLGAGRLFDGLRFAAAGVTPPGPAPVDPRVEAFTKELLAVLIKSRGDPVKVEAELIEVLARVHAAGQLAPVLEAVTADPRVKVFLPHIPDEKRSRYAAQLAYMIGAELEGAGKIPGTKPFEPWDAMGRRLTDLIARGTSKVGDTGFLTEFEGLTGAVFTQSNKAKPLIDGPASFGVRFSLMRKAKKSIHILSWAFYDDVTGNAAADLLIEKKRQGLDVKVMVDGKTSFEHGAAVLARLQAAGVEVVRFQDPLRKYDGLHTKVMVIDGRFAVAGGMNFGDEYSHMGKDPKWRDTDMLYMGPSVTQSARFIAGLWNAQVRAQGLAHGLIEMPAEQAASGAPGAKVAFLAQDPEGEAEVLLAHLKAIAGARKVINIENAYVITFPALRTALLSALARGVKVNILTNSAESVDEPIVSAPILASLPELIKAGAKVSLKRGATLHSKFMTVDGLFSLLGSFNLHPRSVRYERELVLAVLDARFAAELDLAFAADVAAAQAIPDGAALKIPDSALTRLVQRYLFNQL